MKVLEYRIVMPLTLEEVTPAQSPIATHLTPQYERGHLYSVCKSSRLETGKGEGFEFLVHSLPGTLPQCFASVFCLSVLPRVSQANEPFEDHRGKGTFTHKIIHLHSRLPRRHPTALIGAPSR